MRGGAGGCGAENGTRALRISIRNICPHHPSILCVVSPAPTSLNGQRLVFLALYTRGCVLVKPARHPHVSLRSAMRFNSRCFLPLEKKIYDCIYMPYLVWHRCPPHRCAHRCPSPQIFNTSWIMKGKKKGRFCDYCFILSSNCCLNFGSHQTLSSLITWPCDSNIWIGSKQGQVAASFYWQT